MAAGGLGIVLVLFLIGLGVVAARSGDDDDDTAAESVEAGQESPGDTVVLAPGETAVVLGGVVAAHGEVSLGLMLALFIWGRWRYDVVALGVLVIAVVVGLVPMEEAFVGFGHNAVVTVALVLILSRGLTLSGAVDLVAQVAVPNTKRPIVLITSLAAIGAVISAFMNNVGALALLMPIAMQASANAGVSPVEFDNIDPTYAATFNAFTAQRLFTPLGSNI